MNLVVKNVEKDKLEALRTPARILFVDDDEYFLAYLRNCLSQLQPTWEMDFVDNAEDASELVLGQCYDLVITDVVMPNMNGLDLFESIRESSPETDVILMTGIPNIDAAIASIKCGAAEYLRKPFGLTRLEDTILDVLYKRTKHMANDTCSCITHTRRSIAGYDVVRKLDEGSMGTVFLVEHSNETQLFALKVLKISTVPPEDRPRAVSRFHGEAEVASKLDHPNIIELHDFGLLSRDRTPYMVMEYFDGVQLDEMIKEGNDLSYNDKADIIRQIASALEEVHRHVSCHRDIKPGNILVNNKNEVRLIDFGVAKLPDSHLTEVDCIIGTPAYIAPEAILRTEEMDYRADFFSLGVVAYELFLGQRPFTGANIMTLARQIANLDPIDPRELDPDIPPTIRSLIKRLLSKQPDKRYRSAGEIVYVLDRFLGRTPVATHYLSA